MTPPNGADRSIAATRREPPERVYLRWCPTCDRTDRLGDALREGHFCGGKKCPGVPVDLVYALWEDNRVQS